VYEFGSPPDNCFKGSTTGFMRFFAARTGKVWIEESTGNVMRLEEFCADFPARFQQTDNVREVAWDWVKIGSEKHLLPVSAKSIIGTPGNNFSCVSSEFKNHRHFEADSSITYR